MKTKRTYRAAFALMLILPLAAILSSCNNDSIHSATDGGNLEMQKDSAKNSDTSSTPNVSTDKMHN